MPESHLPLDRAEFEQRLIVLGFARQEGESGQSIWLGSVRVTWRDSQTNKSCACMHQIKIILEKGFPFQKPQVFPVDSDPPIVGQRHQAPGTEGALCLYPDDGRGWMPEYTADDLKKRVCQWFIHYHSDDWPDRDRAPDLHLYFAGGSRSVMVYGDDWKPAVGQVFGRFGVWQVTHERAFAGSPTDGYKMPSSEHSDRILLMLGLAGQPLSRIGLWFRLKEEPRAFGTLGKMLEEIDRCMESKVGTARQQVRALMGDKVRDPRHSRLTMALGYPDAAGKEQWLFLQAVAQPSGKQRRWSQAGNDIPVRSFEAAPAGKADLMRRTSHTAKLLNGKKVLLFGTGAIGSSIAVLLAKTGIETLTLVDTDRVRPGNAVRNAAGLRHVGWPKNVAVGLEVWGHAPYCTVDNKYESWDPDELLGWVRESSIVVDATANEAFSLLLNRVCLSADKPAVYVSAYRRAAIGRIRVIRPKIDACKACYDYGYSQEIDYPQVPNGEEGEFTEGGCGVPTVEASAIDIEAIASIAARAAVHLMTGRQGERSECIVVNEPLGEGDQVFSKPGTWWFQRCPLGHCMECG